MPQHRNLAIPGCSVVVSTNREEGISIEECLGIVFGIAGSNPGARVQFHIEVIENAN
jgi:hypothetical protein